ncbi:MAG: FkbM family methyltransferase [Azospirillaceae bacterium]
MSKAPTASKKLSSKKKQKKKKPKDLRARFDEFRMAMRLRFRPRVVTLHGVRVPTDPALIPEEIIDLVYTGRYERAEAELCREVLRPEDRVLELGAGIGFMGSLCAKICGSGRVLTYEANTGVEPVIRRTHKLNRVSPELRMRAIAATSGESTFYFNDNIISSSLIDRDFGGARPVASDSFADVVEAFRPTVIVCDIEGAEVDVLPSADLRGVDRLVIELHPKIVGEESNERLISDLAEQGLHFDRGKTSKVALFVRRT